MTDSFFSFSSLSEQLHDIIDFITSGSWWDKQERASYLNIHARDSSGLRALVGEAPALSVVCITVNLYCFFFFKSTCVFTCCVK